MSGRKRWGGEEQRSRVAADRERSQAISTADIAEINDVISAWINVCTVPLKGPLAINHITVPPTSIPPTSTHACTHKNTPSHHILYAH